VPAIDIFYVDGGGFQILGIASQGGSPSSFFVLMVDAPGSLTPPSREVIVDVFCIDGGCFWISDIASQGGVIDVFCIDGGRS
jgi:hypothetical protein